MRIKQSERGSFKDIAWLLDVTESRQPLSESSPIWVRSATVNEGRHTPKPERHPYCEISFLLQGAASYTMIEKETIRRRVGEMMLLGPGLPHWGVIEAYPHSFITVYFLPSVLIEMGPESDGVRILSRFTAQQPAAHRLVCLPPKHRGDFRDHFEELHNEFSQPGFGREMRLRTLLVDMLVKMVRWEQSLGRNIGVSELEMDWLPILKTLKYLRENYTEPVYARQMARAVGLSESRLKHIFQKALGISWVKYLQGYRIHRAAALLNEGRCNVTEAAMSVGFDSLSHFNVTFRSFMGKSPKNYLRAEAAK